MLSWLKVEGKDRSSELYKQQVDDNGGKISVLLFANA